MGTALTGNTISSSYLGLIKTTDSAAISSSAKVLTDGAGNDSPLYLSTSRLGIGITPTSTLHVSGDFTLTGALKDTSGDAGTSGQILSSTGSGTNWIDNDVGDITSVVAGDGLTGGGTSGAVTINAGAGNLIDVQADQIDVDLSELTTSTSDGDGDFFAVVDSANAQKKLTKANINLSGFNNDIVSGTTGTLAKFTSSSAVGDSIVSESSSTLLIDPTGSGSPVGNIALTLLGVSGQDEQVYIYATGSSAENASIKLVPVSGGYGHIISSGNGLRLGTSGDTDEITITASLVEITEDVQLTGTAPNIVFNDSAVTKNIAKILANVDSAGTNGGKLEFQTVADSGASYITALAIDDSQQVGIGTTTPSTLLNLESSSTSALLIANRTNAVDGTKNLIDFKLDADDNNSYSAGSIGVEAEGSWTSTAGTRDGSIIFRPSVNGTDTAGMVLTSSFDLGVGLTSPSDYYATDVVISANDEGGLTFASTGTTFKQYIAWADGTSGDAQYRGYIAYDHNNDSMAIATSGSAKATIDSNGNIGIGTTSPDSKLHVDSGVSSTSDWGNLGIISDFPINNTGRIYTSYLLQDSESIKAAAIGLAYDGTGYKMHFGTASTTSSGISTAATIDSSQNATFAGIVTTDKIFVAKGQNISHGTSLIKISQESTAKSQIRFYGADTSTAGSLEFMGSSSDGSAGAVRMTIDSTGNLKLGSLTTGTPAVNADDLVIDKGATESGMTIISTTAASLRFGDAANTSIGFIEYNHSSNAMSFGINASTQMIITSGGDVGIGITSPTTHYQKVLHIHEPSGSANIHITNNTTGSTQSDGCDLIAYNDDFYIWNREAGNLFLGTSATTRMTIDSAGNIGIGTTGPSYALDVEADDSGVQLQMGRTNTSVGSTWMGSDSNGFHLGVGAYGTGNSVSDPNGITITTDGKVLIGTTSSVWGSEALTVYKTTAEGIAVTTNDVNHTAILTKSYAASTSAHYVLYITKSNDANVGKITHNDTSTSYDTTSDYRLKEDLKDFSGLDTLSKIKMYDFKWKDYNQRQQGAIAHELEEIIPYAVTGEKDGTRIYKGKEIPEYQGVDYAKLVPMLVKSVQELEARVKELENK